jgi:hypothetical protein
MDFKNTTSFLLIQIHLFKNWFYLNKNFKQYYAVFSFPLFKHIYKK